MCLCAHDEKFDVDDDVETQMMCGYNNNKDDNKILTRDENAHGWMCVFRTQRKRRLFKVLFFLFSRGK